MEIFTWTITIFSVVGVVLNIQKNKICFYIWAGTNFSWMIVDFYYQIWAQSLLFAVYFILALWGILKWRRDK